MKKFFISILSSFLFLLMLQGCAGTLLISTIAIVSKTMISTRTLGNQIDDFIIETKLISSLIKDSTLRKEAHIVITVYDGEILLTGQAPTLKLVNRAETIAMNTHGINKIYNQIRLNFPLSIKNRLIDMWITTRINFYILTNRNINFSNIKITTENKEVFLLGFLTCKEVKLMYEIFNKIKEIKHVSKIFRLLK